MAMVAGDKTPIPLNLTLKIQGQGYDQGEN